MENAVTAPRRRSTAIEWTDHTWNPFAGCLRVSEGCRNCYAERLAGRLEAMGQATYKGTTRNGKWTGKINRASDATMRKPFGFQAGARVFVNSMSDFWHENAKDAWRLEAIEIMRALPGITFQILTKRPENVLPILKRMGIAHLLPRNVWLGATVEDGRVADRIAHVARFPAAIKFLSIEPITARFGRHDLSNIDWIITGGESGPGCRICNPEWIREVRDQCIAGDIALFHKQFGHYRSNPLVFEQGKSIAEAKAQDPFGKGGGLLDGKLWREMPKN